MSNGTGKPFGQKLMDSITAKVIGYLVVLPAVMIWFGWVYGGQIYQRSWVLPVANAQTLNLHLAAAKLAEEEREKQYAQIQKDLSDLKMIWGFAMIQTTGTDEVYAIRNTDSPALRFRPGQEIWITNNSDDGHIRIKCVIREGGFTDKNNILLRLSSKAGRELEAVDRKIEIGIAIVEPGK